MAIAVKSHTRAGLVLMDARKALYLVEHRALLLGDIHFEKGSFLQAAGGHALPTLDTLDNLNRLGALVRAYKPQTIVALGDSFHDMGAEARMKAEDVTRLNRITDGTDMVWVLGNHDPDVPSGVYGRREDHIELGGFLLTHHPHDPGPVVGEGGVNVCGHLHPKARVLTHARAVSGPCFAVCSERIVVPSFGAYTGGLWVSDPAFAEETMMCVADCRFYIVHRGHIAPVDTRRIA